MQTDQFLHAFREAAPYIHHLRGKTIVIGIVSALLDKQTLARLAADINLLSALGVRLVLVHGTDEAVRAACARHRHSVHSHQNRIITDETVLQYVQQVCGEHQFAIQAALSNSITHTLQRGIRLRTVTGNYITAKPLGVLEGVDMRYTGQVRRIDHEAVKCGLDGGAVVVVSPLGISPAGQGYSLTMPDAACAAATALSADKLIFLIGQNGILTVSGSLKSQIHAAEARDLLAHNQILPEQRGLLEIALSAVEGGVSRVQILSGSRDGDLLSELFTRRGVGTSIAQDSFTHIRAAGERDIADIIALIRPLEQKGVLLPRSREYLEAHIGEFFVLEDDRRICGCVALKTFADTPDVGELACLVVSQHAREGGYGEMLLAHIVQQAKNSGKRRLFSLSTHAADWFAERGFQAADLSSLPPQRQAEYLANKRQSKIFLLHL